MEPKGLWPWNLVCSIRCSRTTKFVQMMTLGLPWPILLQGQIWSLVVGSHCRSEFDRPSNPNSLTKLNQLLYTTFSRLLLDRTRPPHDNSWLLHDFNPTTNPISARSSRPLHYLDLTNPISTWSRPDQINLVVQGSWGIGWIEVKLIGYWLVKFFYPDETRSLHDLKKPFPDQLDLYSTNTGSLPDGFSSA